MITIYKTPNCKYCDEAKAYFTEKGLEFYEIDVTKNDSAKYAVLENTGRLAVPAFYIHTNNKTFWTSGFDREYFDKMLKI